MLWVFGPDLTARARLDTGAMVLAHTWSPSGGTLAVAGLHDQVFLLELGDLDRDPAALLSEAERWTGLTAVGARARFTPEVRGPLPFGAEP